MAKEDLEHDDTSILLEFQLRCIAYLWLLINPNITSVTMRLNQRKGEIDMTITQRKGRKR